MGFVRISNERNLHCPDEIWDRDVGTAACRRGGEEALGGSPARARGSRATHLTPTHARPRGLPPESRGLPGARHGELLRSKSPRAVAGILRGSSAPLSVVVVALPSWFVEYVTLRGLSRHQGPNPICFGTGTPRRVSTCSSNFKATRTRVHVSMRRIRGRAGRRDLHAVLVRRRQPSVGVEHVSMFHVSCVPCRCRTPPVSTPLGVVLLHSSTVLAM